MSWLDTTQYNTNDICPICHDNYGTSKAIFKTVCKPTGHIFHNDCLLEYCIKKNGKFVCPICRSNVKNACIDVSEFKAHNLGSSLGIPLFNGNQHILNIYNKNYPPS
jgi:hypothetical protein